MSRSDLPLYGPRAADIIDAILPQSARDMAKYQIDPRWAAQLLGGERPAAFEPAQRMSDIEARLLLLGGSVRAA